MLKKELSIFIFNDLLQHFPYRHVDKTKISLIRDINPQTEYAQVAGVLVAFEAVGQKAGKRIVGQLKDPSGFLELTWFQGLNWIQKTLKIGEAYLVYGRVTFYQGRPQIIHPEMEIFSKESRETKNFLEPVYPTTEKLKSKGLGGKQIGKLTGMLLNMLHEKDIPENLPEKIVKQLKLPGRFHSYQQIHFPQNLTGYEQAVKRLKFEELFLAQLKMGLLKVSRHKFSKGVVFDKVGDLFNTFYKKYLPFELTGA
ncbi:MAG TPA: OB-fold nucleic acid binding domain-containing protein, partial [Chitinophagaceae bacterium]|nr:OB-fold nucleic acid binding domain-containing protein [Chitinophagaceae bacterium]